MVANNTLLKKGENMKKYFPNKSNKRKMIMARRNRKISNEMKTLDGLMKFFQEENKRLVVNGRG